MCHPSSVELHHDIVGAFNAKVMLAADQVIDAPPLLVPELAIVTSKLVTLGLCNIDGLDDPVATFFFQPVLDGDRSTYIDHVIFQHKIKHSVMNNGGRLVIYWDH